MDPRLLDYYNRELRFVREMGAEFAEAFPKIAGRLRLEGFECADPYVERLLEGFAFLAARVQLKIDAEFPQFTQHLLEMVYPHYLSPLPSAALVQLTPDLAEGSLVGGFSIPRGSALRGRMVSDDLTPCEFQTAHDVDLWPLRIAGAEYFVSLGELGTLANPRGQRATAAVRLRLETTASGGFRDLALDRLVLHLTGPQALPMRLYEMLLARTVAIVVQPAEQPARWHEVLPRECLRQFGFADEQAMLPHGPRSFQGYRLLQEYFMLPQRYMFLELTGLGPPVRRCQRAQLDVIFLLNEAYAPFKTSVDTSLFQLFVTPAVNLLRKRTDRIHLSDRAEEYQVIPDRTRPLDFEVFRLESVAGYGAQNEHLRDFRPFYSLGRDAVANDDRAYYAVHRVPRLRPARSSGGESRSTYPGSEVYVSLVDSRERVVATGLKQLSLTALCTNRDLPLFLQSGRGATDFTLVAGAPVSEIRCLAGPTRPRAAVPDGEHAWRLISHLCLNYFSLVDRDEEVGADGLRELLSLYGQRSEAAIAKQIEGVRSVNSRAVTRLLTGDGPSSLGRGMEITVTLDESAFEGLGGFLLGAVLERFFARYASINAFTETVVRTLDRGEVMRWPLRRGRRHAI